MAWMEKVPRPQRFKIYAPDGTCKVAVGWLHIGYVPPPKEACHMLFTGLGETAQPINKLAVVINAETGKVVYNPRKPPELPPWAEGDILTKEHKTWLIEHPYWPNVLEIDMTDEDRTTWDWED